MIDPGKTVDADRFKPFEGMWLAAKPSHASAFAKLINGRLLIPCSLDDRKLSGHYYDCRVENEKLYCRFENFDSAHAGVAFLAVGPNSTLQGGRWMNDKLSATDQQNSSQWSEALPGTQPAVWIRILKNEVPAWAEKYFLDEWPNKI